MKHYFFLVLILPFFSCQKEATIENPEYHLQCFKEDGPGYQWQLDKIVENGTKRSLSECDKNRYLCFNENGSFGTGQLNVEDCSFVIPDSTNSGSWALIGDTLILNEVKGIITFPSKKKFELNEVGRDYVSTYKLERG